MNKEVAYSRSGSRCGDWQRMVSFFRDLVSVDLILLGFAVACLGVLNYLTMKHSSVMYRCIDGGLTE